MIGNAHNIRRPPLTTHTTVELTHFTVFSFHYTNTKAHIRTSTQSDASENRGDSDNQEISRFSVPR